MATPLMGIDPRYGCVLPIMVILLCCIDIGVTRFSSTLQSKIGK